MFNRWTKWIMAGAFLFFALVAIIYSDRSPALDYGKGNTIFLQADPVGAPLLPGKPFKLCLSHVDWKRLCDSEFRFYIIKAGGGREDFPGTVHKISHPQKRGPLDMSKGPKCRAVDGMPLLPQLPPGPSVMIADVRSVCYLGQEMFPIWATVPEIPFVVGEKSR
jgi:hypothetical protein